MYKIVGYRKKVVRQNLRNSFPEKSADELKAIERKFYHYICDYMLESIKMPFLSKDELLRRITFKNTEQYLEMLEKYGGIIIMMPHYANYEWTVSIGSFMKEGDIPMQVYKPIKNKVH
jgi:Lauroyl/myristoyl acyltransferase